MSSRTEIQFPHAARRFARTVCVLGGAVLVLGLGAGVANAARVTNRLRDGLTLTRVKNGGPVRYRVLTLTNPAAHTVTLDVGSAGPRWPAWKVPSAIAQSHNAAAAVNGDFAVNGHPVHVSEEDGDLHSTGIATGVGFAFKKNEMGGYARRPGNRIRLLTAKGSVAPSFDVDVWNAGGVGGGRMAAFSQIGGGVSKPEGDACWARLIPTSQRRWAPSANGVERDYSVQAQDCTASTPVMGSDPGAVVVEAKRLTPKGDTVKLLDAGNAVTLRWSLDWIGQVDAIGGAPQLLTDPNNDGRPNVVAPKNCGSYFCNRNPRTGVGINRACANGNGKLCKVFIVVVDGRQPKWSIGVDLVQFARIFQRLGATWAVNLDGGGGTEMWVHNTGSWCIKRVNGGCLVNKVSDPRVERPAVSALLVLPGPDSEETIGPAAAAPIATGASLPVVTYDDAAATDPGSTGGLVAAMERGGLGGARVLPPALEQVYAQYRAAQAARP